ncbi:MAG: EAL domain-containing protein [Selenomonadaceae bacterium]|nr:EAL domain-containing protein [Selenomonadaceae bacterium]
MMNYRSVATALLVSLTLGLSSATAAPQHLRVGYIPGTGFWTEDIPGHVSGYGYEYMQFLSRYGDWEFEYVPSRTWQESNEKLQSGEIDILPAMPGDYKTLNNVVRTDHVVGRLPMELILADGTPKAHLRLGNIPANPPLPSLPRIAQGEGFTYELINYPLFYDMEEAFRRGEIDGYIAPRLHTGDDKFVLAHFDRQSYRLLVRPDRQDLLADLNESMDQMLMDQPGIRDRLTNKYYLAGGGPLILNHQEKNYLQEKGELTAVIFARERPYYYREGSAELGVYPELSRQIEKDLGVKINLVTADSAEEAIQMLKAGKVDFVVDAVCDFSWCESIHVAPTQSYLGIEYVPVMRRGHELTEARRVACDPRLLHVKTYIFSHYDEANRLLVNSLEEGFKAVGDGRADVVYVPRSAVSYLMDATGAYNLEVVSESAFTDPISLGVNLDADSRLWRILNKEVNHFDANKVRNMVNMGAKTAPVVFSPKWLVYHYPLHALGVAILVLLFIAFASWYRMRLRKDHLAVVQRMAYTDLRYQLPNLLWLEEHGPELYRQAQNDHSEIFAAVFAMDNRAGVALPYGRELLDKQLQNMAAQLTQSDWIITTVAGNNVGQLVCLCRAESENTLSRLALNVVSKHGYIVTKEARIWLHMHVGLCKLEAGDESGIMQAVEKAQTAAQEAQGKDIDLQIFDEDLEKELTLTQQMESHMESALENGEFQAWYQPKYDIRTHKITGAEALVRWQSPELGFLPPGRFIPLFEKNGFVIPLDYFLLESACRLQKARLAEGKPVVPISVNQSRLHITEEDYLEKIHAVVKKYNLPPGLLELELTETVFGDFDQAETRERARGIIRSLHSMGFKISVDDFGSGYSSYMLLNYLPLDVMKIDRSMLTASDDSERMRAILGNIIQLGEMLGMEVLCEGIETPEQEKLLLELGCCYGQGYLNSKPLPEADFIAFCDARQAG